MTYLEVINRVLRNLREDPVSNLSAEYTLLVGEWVNQIKEELDTKAPWPGYHTVVNVTVAADATSANITGTANDGSDLWYEPATGNVNVYDVTDDPLDLRYNQVTPARWLMDSTLETANRASSIQEWGIRRKADNTLLEFVTYPAPATQRTVRMSMFVPQDSYDDVTDIVRLPVEPLVLGATALGFHERGEELGPSPQDGLTPDQRYTRAAAAAIARAWSQGNRELGGLQLQPR